MSITFKKDGVELIGNQWDILKDKVLVEIKEIIEKIEQKFGPIDKTYSLTAINFNSQDSIVTQVDEIKKTIIINLPAYNMENDNNSTYQRKLNLSHELIHTITPCEDPNKTTFLDEGLAVVFSEAYTGCDSSPSNTYFEARKYVLKLLQIDNEIIKKLRKKYPEKKISDYTTQDIMEDISLTSLNLIQNLTKHFYS